jgi:hypothetical protein
MLKTVLRVLFGLGLCTIISGCMIYSSLGLPWEAQNLDGSTSITWRSGGSLLVLIAITQSISFWTFHRRIAQKVLLGLISFVGVAILILQSSFFLLLGAKRSRWHLPAHLAVKRRNSHLEWTLRKLSYVRRGGRESTFTHRYASLVETVHSHSSRGPFRRRSGQPQVSAPRGLHPPTRRRHLQLPPARPALAEQGHRHCARGDGQDRPGVLSARDSSPRVMGAERPLDGHGRQHVPAQGPQGRRTLPGHDA